MPDGNLYHPVCIIALHYKAATSSSSAASSCTLIFLRIRCRVFLMESGAIPNMEAISRFDSFAVLRLCIGIRYVSDVRSPEKDAALLEGSTNPGLLDL